MNIRLATIDDYESLMQLYSDFTDDARYLEHASDSFAKVLESANARIYVVEIEGKLAGFAAMSVRSVIRYPTPIVQLEELYVAPEQRKHGIGKALVRKVEATAQELGCQRMYIESRIDLANAHEFYQAIGFPKNGYYFKKDI